MYPPHQNKTIVDKIKNYMKEEYFKAENVILVLSECDKDMIAYALNHTDWTDYKPEDFGGENADVAANIHFADIMAQLGID